MAQMFVSEQDGRQLEGGPAATIAEMASFEPALLPLLAGARARGMCDAFNLLNIAVVMIDAAGMVLHVNPAARAFLGRHLTILSDHLVTENYADTKALHGMIGEALQGRSPVNDIVLQGGSGERAIRLRVAPLENAGDDSFQLLKALVILEECAVQ